MATLWRHQPQEVEGDYFFNGQSHITRLVYDQIPFLDIISITTQIKSLVKAKNGIDYLQVFKHPSGSKIFCIDSLSQSMIESGDYTAEQIQAYNHWTMMFAEEY